MILRPRAFKIVLNIQKQDQPPPGRIASILRLLTDGRQASLLEVEEVVEWLEKKRVDLGGFPRTFSSNNNNIFVHVVTNISK